jgi:uncharacterized protein (DUF924 family)
MHPSDILKFWFEESSPRQWFARSDAFDAEIRARFFDTYERAARGETESWRQTPEGRLAEIIVLDQFSRNLFREDPRAFAQDERALSLAQEAIAAGADKKLSAAQRQFLYMPFMHSESKQAHARAVRLFRSLPFWRWAVLYFELRHKRIIDRFGRYPHRNKALGRASTPEEETFLKTHKGF